MIKQRAERMEQRAGKTKAKGMEHVKSQAGFRGKNKKHWIPRSSSGMTGFGWIPRDLGRGMTSWGGGYHDLGRGMTAWGVGYRDFRKGRELRLASPAPDAESRFEDKGLQGLDWGNPIWLNGDNKAEE